MYNKNKSVESTNYIYLILSKIINWINLIGLISVSVILYVKLFVISNDAWGIFYFAIHILTSLPFIISSIIVLKYFKKIDIKLLKRIILWVYLVLLIPSISLPFYFETGGLLICLTVLTLGFLGVFILRDLTQKLIFISLTGTIFLLLHCFLVLNSF